MAKVTAGDIQKGWSITKTILGFLTDIRDKLPKWGWLQKGLQWGRDKGAWQHSGPGSISGPHQ